MELWKTATLTRHIPSRTTWNHLLLTNEQKDWKLNREFYKAYAREEERSTKPCQQTFICQIDGIALDMSKALLILLPITVNWFAVKREDLKSYWKSEK